MPFWIEGWIEVAPTQDTAAPYAWFGVADLSSLVEVADADTERLFGLSKLCVSGEKSVDALAAHRGVPPNPSAHVRRELEVIVAHEAKFGPGECGGYTHAIWTELKAHHLSDAPEGSQWHLAFAIARVLEDRFHSDRIRFVVWFNW